MKSFFKEIKKHLFIYCLFVKNSLMSQLEYRFNFFTGIAMELGYLLVKILYPVIIYRAGTNINGFTPDEFLVFIGTYIIITSIYAGFFMMNLYAFRNLVREGQLDLLIVKPVSLQFIATLRRSDIGLFLIDFSAGSVLVAVGLTRINLSLSLLDIFGYALFVAAGAIVGYAFFLIPQVLNFWFFNTGALVETIDSFWDFNNVPMVVYEKFIQNIGVFIIPIFVITNFPALFLLKKLSPVFFVWGLLAPVIFLFLSRIVWKLALKNYSSASS